MAHGDQHVDDAATAADALVARCAAARGAATSAGDDPSSAIVSALAAVCSTDPFDDADAALLDYHDKRGARAAQVVAMLLARLDNAAAPPDRRHALLSSATNPHSLPLPRGRGISKATAGDCPAGIWPL
jgi:hypothetical protein